MSEGCGEGAASGRPEIEQIDGGVGPHQVVGGRNAAGEVADEVVPAAAGHSCWHCGNRGDVGESKGRWGNPMKCDSVRRAALARVGVVEAHEEAVGLRVGYAHRTHHSMQRGDQRQNLSRLVPV
jgi:hypothetical protein